MATLEKVMQMKRQGFTESQIIKQLQEERLSPKEISDALTQSQIKQAVSMSAQNENQQMDESIINQTNQQEMYAPEIPIPSPQIPSPEETYLPQTLEQYPQQNYPQEQYQENYGNPQYPQQNYPSEQYQENYNEEYYPQEGYSQGSYSQGGMDNMIEIAEQVVSEKVKKLKEQMEDFLETKNILTTKMDNFEERLKRMEKMFDQMQISIIEKVGTYGKGLDTMKKELEMVEDSFSKIVNKVLEKDTHSKKKK